MLSLFFSGHHKNCSNNVILYPGIDGRSAGNRRCQTDDNGQFAVQFHENNICTITDGAFYSFSGCENNGSINQTVYHTRNNTLLSDPGSSFAQPCSAPQTFSGWQALGQDEQSIAAVTPSVPELIALGSALVLRS
jgi:hypothetical protein